MTKLSILTIHREQEGNYRYGLGQNYYPYQSAVDDWQEPPRPLTYTHSYEFRCQDTGPERTRAIFEVFQEQIHNLNGATHED